MKAALFIVFPIPSHYLAMFPLAQNLRDQGHTIIFTAPDNNPTLRALVEAEGFTFHPVAYSTEVWVSTASTFFGLMLTNLLETRSAIQRYRTWYRPVLEIQSLCKTLNPSAIYVDEHLTHYYLYLYAHREIITLLNTKLSTRKFPGVPPLNSGHIPTGTWISRIISEAQWIRLTAFIKMQMMLQKIANLGTDDVFFESRLCQRFNTRWKDLFDTRNCFYTGLKGARTLVLAPACLEYPLTRNSARYPHETYLSLPIIRNESAFRSRPFEDIRLHVSAAKAQGRPVIYCAFGSISFIDQKRIEAFFKKLMRVFEHHSGWCLVLATGGLAIDAVLPANVHVLKKVPQLEMLSLCDVMITHGGLTTTKECLQANVPMLVYAINKKSDPNGNASRVYANGFGLKGSMETDSEKTISQKLETLLSMRDRLSERMATLFESTDLRHH
jgi:UDP:flavonoid glycosyltransferase YjiC (YdhE family)